LPSVVVIQLSAYVSLWPKDAFRIHFANDRCAPYICRYGTKI